MVDLPDVRARDIEGLARSFRYFGEVETSRLDSDTDTAFSLGIAQDPELLAMASGIAPGQPAPNIFFAAVQDLLLADPERSLAARALARFYPAVSGEPIPAQSPWPAFRVFSLEHADALAARFRSGRTQTCVVHRCAIVLPALASLPRVAAAGGRIGLLELGPSAGLNLRLDRYRYRYAYEDGRGARVDWGNEDAKPLLRCEARGNILPPVPPPRGRGAPRPRPERHRARGSPGPQVDARIDLARARRACARDGRSARPRGDFPIEIEEGDATREIEDRIAKLPIDVPRVLFATHVVYQISPEGVLAMFDAIARASFAAPIDLVIMDSTGRGDSRLDHIAFEDGERKSQNILALSDSHGRWIEWRRQA